MIEFQAWPKTPRFNRTVWVTEKIDGTNAAIVVRPFDTAGELPKTSFIYHSEKHGPVEVAYQSRKRLITPADDNFGFANWAFENTPVLVESLGLGIHFGEWWGSGIQRGYGLTKGEKRFSLFNVGRWFNKLPDELPDEVNTVPVLYVGQNPIEGIVESLGLLQTEGSKAVLDGFDKPEGVIVHFSETRQNYKILLENDDISKTEADNNLAWEKYLVALQNQPRGHA